MQNNVNTEQIIFKEVSFKEYEPIQHCRMLSYNQRYGYNCKKNQEQNRVSFRFCKEKCSCIKVRKTMEQIKPNYNRHADMEKAREAEKAFLERERESLRPNGQVSGKRGLFRKYGIKAKF